MPNYRSLLTLSFLLCAAAVHGASPAGGDSGRMLNNEGLVVLARAGYNERFLAELIQSQPNRFDTSVEGLVYLAKQGISERIVRLVIAEQKALERRQAEHAAADADETFKPAGETQAKAAVRLKMVKQKVLVPVSHASSPVALDANPVIVVEKRMFGDRYYALPGAQAPMTTPVATPRSPQSMQSASATRVASFH